MSNDNARPPENGIPDPANTPQPPGLSPADRRHLAALEQKLQVVRDFTGSVATGRTTGYFLWGKGGCGKSHTVIEELERLRVPYKLFNSRMTGRGLFNALEEFPDSVHLLEDMEPLFRDSGACGVLRSALWGVRPKGDGPTERRVTWTTYKMEHSFVFTGGIVMTANRPFPERPELEAVKTRIEYMQLAVGDQELIAKMRAIALGGYRRGRDVMDPDECLAVCEFIVGHCRGLNRAMDLRLLLNGFQDYLQWRDCRAGCHWRDLVATRVKERPIGLEEMRTYAERNAQMAAELAVARELEASDADREERARLWRDRTGKSEQTLYRRLAELRKEDSPDSH